jgi:ketosteroid isomerase-like protein
MAEETPDKPIAEKAAKAKPPAKEKKPQVEEKPFAEFIEQDFNPALTKALADKGIGDLKLTFAQQSLPLKGTNSQEKCWQVIANWQNGQRQFNLYFLDADISGQKAFSYTSNGSSASTIESFMIDERKVTLDLMVLYTLQRLNGQKWLTRN